MSAELFEVPTPSVPVADGDGDFPVHRVYCIGRNYAEHVQEMGGTLARSSPVYFLKPADSIVPGGGDVAYPPRTAELHHEIELVVALGKGGRDIDVAAARDHVFGYAVGIDLTRRDLQRAAKESGAPWDTAKSFEQAAPVSPLRTVAAVGHPRSGRIWLSVDGMLRQDADIGAMIWSVEEAIADLSTYYHLRPGDLLFTGTPAGVGALQRGNRVEGGVGDVATLSVTLT